MKIAIIAPSPVPFTIGGAENLMWGLCENINQLTNNQAELIKMPSKEHSFWDLIENYYNFYKLDLTHFDMVISSKYPSWMVQHPNSICYMMHTLRGLYDMYDQSQEVRRGWKAIDKILDYMQNNPNPSQLNTFFDNLFDLKENQLGVPKDFFGFPGPLIRKIIHYMDSFGLGQEGMKKYLAISNTVKNRVEYFPPGVLVEVVYPPTVMHNCFNKDYKYVFMISRLDAPKRIEYLIEAMKYVKSDMKLLIAGTGPEEKKLKSLAAGDERIQFLGFIKDEEAENHYANSLVIPYFPYNEDYGYITIEAMLHQKPVITTYDSGGPTEFVTNGETGFLVNLDPHEIAEKIDYLAENPEVARTMGEKGWNLVKNITWKDAVSKILEEPVTVGKQRKKITVVSTFSVFPRQGGGQVRTYNLYKNLAEFYDVEIISYTWDGQPYFEEYIAQGLKEVCVPRCGEHQKQEVVMEKKVGMSVGDIAMITLGGNTPLYRKKLEESIKKSDMVVLSHPYLYNTAMEYIENQVVIYEAQDVESAIKKEILPDTAYAKELVKRVYDVEKKCCEAAKFILACSEEDRENLSSIYGVDAGKITVVPNGVDCNKTKFTPLERRLEIKKAMNLQNEKIGLFIGSWHGPNLKASEKIIEFAPECKDTKFLIMGSQCDYFKGKTLPENVGLLGMVSEETKNRVFSLVDFALNPMDSGSGTNLKIFDYLSAGIPVITTEFGVRGTNNLDAFIISSIEQMSSCINDFRIDQHSDRITLGRKYVEQEFDWSVSAKKYMEILD